MMKVFRPHIDDVERLSYGRGAKKQRGTGSRSVCHRLNQHERKCYETAKQNHYLCVKGNGYRKERKGSPSWNIFRQRCDALEEICIMIEKRSDEDRVVIDLSTLRVQDDTPYIHAILVNVIQDKYSYLYEEDNAVSLLPTTRSNKRIMNYWDLVRTKPIWQIDERIIIIRCKGIDNRKEAKSIALDVLNECSNIIIDKNNEICYNNNGNQNVNDFIYQRKTVNYTSINKDISTETVSKCASDDEEACIDWDDI